MVRIRTSERRDFKRCPQRWAWTWLDGLVSRTHKDALWFGHGVHVALADWYGKQGRRRGPLPAETWAKWCGDEYRRLRVGETFDEQQYVDAKELGTVMLTGYVDEYGADDWMHVVAREQTFEIVVQRADGTTFLYNGTFDLVFRDLRNGQLWLGEHKTAKQISEAHLTLDDQGGSYLWVATEVLRSKGVLKSNERLHGVMYNFLRKQLPDERPRDAQGYATNMPKKEHYLAALPGKVHPKMTLDVMHGKAEEHGVVVLGDRSAKQPKPNFERFHIWRNDRERVVMAQRVLAEEQHMSAVRSGALPIFKTPTRDCSWDCDHYQMCELHEQAGDWEEFRDVQYKHRDPYADHRKGADEGL
jgi:hypothetical protein